MSYKNRKKAIKAQKSWRKRNRDHCRKYNREYYRKNICSKGIVDASKEEEVEKTRKAKKRERRKKAISIVKKFISDYKNVRCCVRCGESDPICLVFHHIDPLLKEKSISKLYKSGIRKVKEEIKKCILLCANCHMKLHNG